MHNGNCRECGAPIKFIKMKRTGKMMPCNISVLRYAPNTFGSVMFITPDGKAEKGGVVKDNRAQFKQGYMSHYSTCTYAKSKPPKGWKRPSCSAVAPQQKKPPANIKTAAANKTSPPEDHVQLGLFNN